jgi:hypothetical protein
MMQRCPQCCPQVNGSTITHYKIVQFCKLAYLDTIASAVSFLDKLVGFVAIESSSHALFMCFQCTVAIRKVLTEEEKKNLDAKQL